MKIGVCITTTPHRQDIFLNTYTAWRKMMPEDSWLDYHMDDLGEGVAKSKNHSLSMLEREGVTQYFIVDEDCWPIDIDWWKPFVESGENHLLYNFKLPSKGKNDMRVIHEDEKIVSYSHTRGCFMYVTQKVLDTVGGFDENYVNSFEHPDYTNRIHNAGLTTHRSMSPVGADKLLYCLDQDGKVESSIKPDPVRQRKNYQYYRQNRLSKEYKEYRG